MRRSNLFKICYAALALSATVAQAAVPVTLYKSPTCGCCDAYVRYLQANGFQVTAENRNDMDQIKQTNHVGRLGSCHTALIAGYVVEGHVPVTAIQKLLRQKPNVVGISVPGMPANSPGMGAMKPGMLPVYTLTRDQAAQPAVFSVE
ncbi:DUF411 domain-containing protein [Chitinivorax sp. B]|uniref:DUF411 domain-containing protein n=1 Tax=Chitinivorax sp. B TaxID=2502235 RepID=UPI0010F44C60|nr:DUF411 domain-containing protein [Chitinivorax sp. B]